MGSVYNCIRKNENSKETSSNEKIENKNKFKNSYIKNYYEDKSNKNRVSSYLLNQKLTKIYENEPILLESEVLTSNKYKFI